MSTVYWRHQAAANLSSTMHSLDLAVATPSIMYGSSAQRYEAHAASKEINAQM